ncbi:MAG: hypothetical protein A3K66_00770 [Euryarchaeota archaeon RBG_16_67_27]|nr:MAG: hypothetical protein A3K66_00770 [Euryarchaeota archaeon RBG_16_67_27]
MKAAVLGAGGLGRTIALELSADRRIDELVLMDRRGERSRALQTIGRNVAVSTHPVDVTDAASLRRMLEGVDVAVNATLADHNLRIMRACFEAGCGYVDTAAAAPIAAGEKWGVLEQLELDTAWQEGGRTAIISMGSDPGLSNVMARLATDRMARVTAIRIRWAATGSPDIEGFPLYSREMFIRDALSKPVVWDGTRLVEQEIASGSEEFPFPDPVGPRRVHLFRHEEVLTLPQRLGKPVGWVDYKHAINPNLVRAIAELDALGLLARERIVRLGDRAVPFRDAFLAAFPEPSTLIGPITGTLAIVVDVEGTSEDGSKRHVRAWTTMDHKEANRRRGTTAEYYLTAAAATTGMILLATAKAPRHGVLVPEDLPPDAVLQELETRNVKFHIEDVAS